MSIEFNDMVKVDESAALVVDSLNLAFRWKYAKTYDFASNFIDTVKSLAKSYRCGKIIIAADKGSSSYRKALYPDYKGNREELRKNQTEEEKDSFEQFFQGYENTLELLDLEGFDVLRYQGVEADDIAAFISCNRSRFNISNIVLVSSDKDWDLLLDNSTTRFSYVTRKDYTLDNWYDRYPFAHKDYITYKCLVGDSGDNVPGVAGIGDTRAGSIIAEYGDIFDIYNSIPLPGKQKFIQNLNSFGDQLLLNVELMDLQTYCEAAIGKDNVERLIEQLS